MPWWKFREKRGSTAGPDYYEEGVALVRQELYHEALTSFRLALRAKPDDRATIEQMAVVYTHIGLTDEAIKSYRDALRLRPDSPSAHYGLAFLLLKEGDTESARTHLEAFLETEPVGWDEDRHVKHARETLERISTASGAAMGPEAEAES